MAEVPEPSQAEAPDGPEEHPLPPGGTLGDEWASQKLLRNRVKEEGFGYMTRWVNPKAIGVPSVKNMSLNRIALERLASWYCPTQPFPKMISIEVMRNEAESLGEKLVGTK